MSEISYTDDTGTTTFSNDLPMPGSRFSAWTPMNPMAGVEAEALGTGEGFGFKFRDDYGASFTIAEIQQDNVAAALRLIRHLNNYGTVTVTTDDQDGNTYTCKKWKGTSCELSPLDPRTLRHTLKLTLKSTTAVDMLVRW